MSVVTIHQPEHLSYLGFFEKVSRCDTLVLLDCVDYEKNYFQNRNKIYTNQGVEYITVPVVAHIDKIMNIKIHTANWTTMRRKNLNKIEQAYGKAPFFEQYYYDFRASYSLDTDRLSVLNFALLQFVLHSLGIEKRIVLASELNASGSKSELLANICKMLHAEVYLAGGSGKDYLVPNYFDNIRVDYQNFRHPVYTQHRRATFEPYMSVIDALFNVGNDIVRIIAAAQAVAVPV